MAIFRYRKDEKVRNRYQRIIEAYCVESLLPLGERDSTSVAILFMPFLQKAFATD